MRHRNYLPVAGILALLLTACQSPSSEPTAAPPKPVVAVKPPLTALLSQLRQDSLVSYTSAQALPRAVRAFLAAHTADTLGLADVGAPYQATCLVAVGSRLPWRQLVYLGVGRETVLLSYRRGGRGLSQLLAVFQLRHDTIRQVWAGHVEGDPTSKAALLQPANVGRLHAQPESGLVF